jgi:site-specific recombinase XerD
MSSIGTPLIARNVVRSFHKILRGAGLPHHRFYDLRHSCASLLLEQGIPARTIMEILGHSQISLTLNTYSHVSSAMLRDAANVMGSVLARQK